MNIEALVLVGDAQARFEENGITLKDYGSEKKHKMTRRAKFAIEDIPAEGWNGRAFNEWTEVKVYLEPDGHTVALVGEIAIIGTSRQIFKKSRSSTLRCYIYD